MEIRKYFLMNVNENIKYHNLEDAVEEVTKFEK